MVIGYGSIDLCRSEQIGYLRILAVYGLVERSCPKDKDKDL
jgi:hypothetical protein